MRNAIKSQRLPYSEPRLSVLGDVRVLTETGSMGKREGSKGKSGQCDVDSKSSMC